MESYLCEFFLACVIPAFSSRPPCIDCKMSAHSNSKGSNKHIFVLVAFPSQRHLNLSPVESPFLGFSLTPGSGGALLLPCWGSKVTRLNPTTYQHLQLLIGGCWHSPGCQSQLCANDSVCQHACAMTQETMASKAASLWEWIVRSANSVAARRY